mgnify:CR=1 FL=1
MLSESVQDHTGGSLGTVGPRQDTPDHEWGWQQLLQATETNLSSLSPREQPFDFVVIPVPEDAIVVVFGISA